MYELACPECNAAAQYRVQDYLLICPMCSTTFQLDKDSGKKDIFSEHYILPNTLEPAEVKAYTMSWLERLTHSPEKVQNQYMVTSIKGYSVPFWIISLEAHSHWTGMVKRSERTQSMPGSLSRFIREEGEFRCDYRWAINARNNPLETWGLANLHEPSENIRVRWDGFPLDSTFSRGRLAPEPAQNTGEASVPGGKDAYDAKEKFDYKFSNGLAIMPVQVSEEDAIERTRAHIIRYHEEIAETNLDLHINTSTEIEIAGVQLIHLPFWSNRYIYRPRGLMRHLRPSVEKNVLIEGHKGGVLTGELALVQKDKLQINTVICSVLAIVTFFVGAVSHPSFFLISLFFGLTALASAYVAHVKQGQLAFSEGMRAQDLQQEKSAGTGRQEEAEAS